MMKFFWPDIQSLEDAKALSQRAAVFAFFIAIATGTAAYLQIHRIVNIMPGLDAYAYIDAAAFAVIGFFLLKCSRLAALCGLGIYFLDQGVSIQQNGYHFSILPLLIFFGFVSAVRATFAYHEMKKDRDKLEDTPKVNILGVPPEPKPAEKNPGNKSQAKHLFLFASAIALLACAGWFVFQSGKGVSGKQKPFSVPLPALPSNLSKPEQGSKEAVADLQGPHKTFKLKNGATVSGTVTYQDEVYAAVETRSGPVTVIMEDVENTAS